MKYSHLPVPCILPFIFHDPIGDIVRYLAATNKVCSLNYKKIKRN